MSEHSSDEGVGGTSDSSLMKSFKEICAVEEDEIAKSFLDRSNWQLELAIQEFMNEKEGRSSLFFTKENLANQRLEQGTLTQSGPSAGPSAPPAEAGGSASTPPVSPLVGGGALGVLGVGGRRGVQQRRPLVMGWRGWFWALITLPFRLGQSVVWDVCGFIYSVFFRRPAAISDPLVDVHRFLERFESAFGTVHPPFFQGSYSTVLKEARRECRMLIVYLHSWSHVDSDRFCRHAVGHAAFSEFVRENNIIFWACDVSSAEGMRVSSSLRETAYPYIGMICQRDGRMALVMRHEGHVMLDDLLVTLNVALNDNRAHLDAARNERTTVEVNQWIRREQEEEYRASLLADKERQEKIEKEKEKKREQEEKEREQEDRVKRLKEELEQKKAEIKTSLAEEPTEKDGGPLVRVCVKFPNGSRQERNFRLDDSLELLFNATLVHESCPDNFTLFTSFPRKKLACIPQWFLGKFSPENAENPAEIQSFRDAGLERSVLVLVQNNDA